MKEFTVKPWCIPIILGIIILIGATMYRCGGRSRDDEIDSLAVKVAQSEKTVEVKQGLYATSLVQMDDAKRLLSQRDSLVTELRKQLDETHAKVLTTERIVVKWKEPMKASVEATETAVAASAPDRPLRRRVDFRHDFGPFLVSGYTLTDPAEGFVSLDQGRPLALVLTVARNRDGTWASYVSSSEKDMAIDVTLGAVDPGILKPSWYQRIWVTSDVVGYPSLAAGIGMEYRGERISFGPQCQFWNGGLGCGLSFGVRLAGW